MIKTSKTYRGTFCDLAVVSPHISSFVGIFKRRDLLLLNYTLQIIITIMIPRTTRQRPSKMISSAFIFFLLLLAAIVMPGAEAVGSGSLRGGRGVRRRGLRRLRGASGVSPNTRVVMEGTSTSVSRSNESQNSVKINTKINLDQWKQKSVIIKQTTSGTKRVKVTINKEQ